MASTDTGSVVASSTGTGPAVASSTDTGSAVAASTDPVSVERRLTGWRRLAQTKQLPTDPVSVEAKTLRYTRLTGDMMTSDSTTTSPSFRISSSPGFAPWLATVQVSLAFSTYQVGKLFLIGRRDAEHLSIFERTYDRLFVPRWSYTTGDIDVHDVALDGQGHPLFVNTRFSCLAVPCERYNFRPIWQPPFLARFSAEDACHLNGLACDEGQPRFVTMCAATRERSGEFADSGWSSCPICAQPSIVRRIGDILPESPLVDSVRDSFANSESQGRSTDTSHGDVY